MCVLTNKIYEAYQTGFLFDAWVMPQGWDLGVPRGSKKIWGEYGHVAYQIDGDGD